MKTNKERQEEFKARQRKAGLVRTEVWISKDKKAELLAFVESMKNATDN